MQRKYHLNYSFDDAYPLYKDTFLKQIGRRHCSSGEVIEKHAHMNWFELTITIDGEGIVTTNDEAMTISKGDIYLSFPGDIHEIISSNDAPLQYEFFSFSSKNPVIKKEFKKIVAETLSCDKRIFRDDMVSSAVSFALSEVSTEKKYRTEVISSILEQILFLVISKFLNRTLCTAIQQYTVFIIICFLNQIIIFIIPVLSRIII